MMLYPECGYFNEERDDEYAHPYGECEYCYRYDICRRAKTLEEFDRKNQEYLKIEKSKIKEGFKEIRFDIK